MSSRKAKLAGALAGAMTVAVTAAVAVIGSAPVASAATSTFTPVADTYVDNAATGTNYGTSGQLGIDNSSIKRTFIRFTVTGVTGTVSNVKLRIHTDNVSGAQSPNGGTYKLMSNTTWSDHQACQSTTLQQRSTSKNPVGRRTLVRIGRLIPRLPVHQICGPAGGLPVSRDVG